ncbi:MAG: HlyD family type I secretion periplasmic adaptor subunit, partial [Alphaproteobacteria bacterium]|nr:HlyD family type I secretion periplasmic adaptor subunit [Alphaproteobacteria bacterium]
MGRFVERMRNRSERIDRLEIEGLETEILDPDTVNAPKILSQDGVIRFGLLFGFGGFVVFMLWATLVPLSEGVIASGLVAVESQRKTVQHLEGGIVAELLVEEGSSVKAGQLLVQLDTTQPRARHELLQTRYFNTLSLLDRLNAEREGGDAIDFNPELLKRLDDSNVADIVLQHRFLFEARRDQTSGRRDIQQRRVSQLRAQVAGINAQLEAKKRERQLTEIELERLESLRGRDTRLVTVTQLVAQQKSLNQVDSDIGSLQAEIAGARVAISEAELELIQIDLTLRQEVSTELLSAKEQLFEIREQLAATDDVLRRTQILSPQNGKVFGLRIFTVGGVVPPAEPIMEIVPVDDKLVIEAKIRVTDVDNVAPGQAVRARFSAFNARNTPEVNGQVVSVSPDAELDQATQESFYSAIVNISEEEMNRLVGVEVIPGMPVEVFVTGGERTAIDYLLKPITDAARKSLTEG